jgi:hypothetical protein
MSTSYVSITVISQKDIGYNLTVSNEQKIKIDTDASEKNDIVKFAPVHGTIQYKKTQKSLIYTPQKGFVGNDKMIIKKNNELTKVYFAINYPTFKSTSKELKKLKPKRQNKFEKLISNHIAYKHYIGAIKYLYDRNYTLAYDEANRAKSIYDNTKSDIKTIKLPYAPAFIREGPFTPRRIIYEVIRKRDYELKRLIKKIKLLAPPIGYVTIYRGSTYVDIVVQNLGDLPLDQFSIILNGEVLKVFDKITPTQQKKYRYNGVVSIETIEFKEADGFAPEAFELN